jgi:hypothetical protein
MQILITGSQDIVISGEDFNLKIHSNEDYKISPAFVLASLFISQPWKI